MTFIVRCAYCGKLKLETKTLKLVGENEYACLSCMVIANNIAINSINDAVLEILNIVKPDEKDKSENGIEKEQ
jgi:hypothetical protein